MKEDKDWKEKVRELMEKIEDRKDSINISCDCGDGFESNDYYQAVSALEEAENDLFDFIESEKQKSYEEGVEDGIKGRVFEKLEINTEVKFNDLKDVVNGKEDIVDFISKLKDNK